MKGLAGLARGPVPLKRLLDLATQIADGLATAHDAGIVHRDLKPENVMVTRSGRVKILDFGLARGGGFISHAARGSDRDALETMTDMALGAGTAPYMSPEQARGAATDYRSDQFSFGLILFEMLTGRPAYWRATPEATLDAIINEELPSLSGLGSRVPLSLQWLVERCLAKEAGERYVSTADLQRDLKTLRDRLGDARPPEGVRDEQHRTTRSHECGNDPPPSPGRRAGPRICGARELIHTQRRATRREIDHDVFRRRAASLWATWA